MNSISNENVGKLIDIAWDLTTKQLHVVAPKDDAYQAAAQTAFDENFQSLLKTVASAKFSPS